MHNIPLPSKITGAKILILRTVGRAGGAARAIAKNLMVGKRLPSMDWEVQAGVRPLRISGLDGHIPFCLF